MATHVGVTCSRRSSFSIIRVHEPDGRSLHDDHQNAVRASRFWRGVIGVSRINSTLEESIQILLSLLIAVYGTVLSLQVGSVASNQPRWTVFIISLGVGLIVLLVFKLLTAPLSPFGLAFY